MYKKESSVSRRIVHMIWENPLICPGASLKLGLGSFFLGQDALQLLSFQKPMLLVTVTPATRKNEVTQVV